VYILLFALAHTSYKDWIGLYSFSGEELKDTKVKYSINVDDLLVVRYTGV